MKPSRRVASFCLALCCCAAAASAEPRHGLSIFGDLKYPPDFRHFEYVNPEAPKGGRMVTVGTLAMSTFDSFNGYILKGDPAQGLGLTFDTLMARAYDEPDAMYGRVAKTADVAADRSSVTFELRPEARFSDGSSLTAEDVCDTFRLLSTEGHERIRITIRDVKSCTVLTPTSVRYAFAGENVRDLPLIVAELPIFSKAYYAKTDFTKTTLEPPLGSGPYAIGSFKQGVSVTFVRRPDYWGKDLPVNRGHYNFNEVRYEYFRDTTAGFEAFKAGLLDLKEDFSSKSWATGYAGLAAIKEGRLIKEELPDETMSGAQGFYINLRREKFQDIRVRKALDLAFDFEWSNLNLFYGIYQRTSSIFEGADLEAEGKPAGPELKILEPLRSELRPEVFGEVYQPPVTDASGADRKLLREASRLLDEAGWKAEGGVRRNAKGEALKIEFLENDPVFERIMTPYVRNLRVLGIEANVRLIDEAQFQRRLEDYDYDMIVSRFSLPLTPGVELRGFFGADAAKNKGSYNLAGMSIPAVDKLIDKIIMAADREELKAACRALDRVLRAEHFWVPHWHKRAYNVAYWNQFDRPKIKPK
ncbi:MAG: extracellular solute-binding protein, partial [Pseudomonadota bacterium]|nr:extracellular solute-binding protein [Pseudomonadota bacterium]